MADGNNDSRINSQPRESGCSQLGKAIRNDPIFQNVYKIVSLEDIVRSVLVFAIGTSVFYLVTFLEYTFITLFSYALILVLLASLVATRLKGAEVVDYFRGNPNDQQMLRTYSGPIAQTIVAFRSFLLDFFLWRRFLPTLIAFVSFLILSQFAKLFTGTSLFYISFFFGFVVPKAYSLKKDQIDQAVSKAYSIVSEKWKIVESKVPQNIKLNLD